MLTMKKMLKNFLSNFQTFSKIYKNLKIANSLLKKASLKKQFEVNENS